MFVVCGYIIISLLIFFEENKLPDIGYYISIYCMHWIMQWIYCSNCDIKIQNNTRLCCLIYYSTELENRILMFIYCFLPTKCWGDYTSMVVMGVCGGECQGWLPVCCCCMYVCVHACVCVCVNCHLAQIWQDNLPSQICTSVWLCL